MKRNFRSAFVSAAVLIVASIAIVACGELTGPESPSTPTNVVATLETATSVTVSWTPSPLNDGVISYSIYRNGAKVGESTTTSFTDTGLAQQTTYVYSVAANCKGGVVSDRSAETPESTVTTVDITAPTVITHQPPTDFNGASSGATVTATFSEPMDPATINATTFSLRVFGSGASIPGSVTYNTTTRVAEFTPASALPNPVKITATVSTGARDLAGNALAAAVTWSFTTRDDTAPTVSATSPANGAAGVGPASLVTITFSESVQAATINATNITLKLTSSGATVAGTLAFNGTDAVTFTPSAPLAQGNYTLTVSNVKDVAGNLMASPSVTTFTVDATPPTVSSIVPTNGAVGVATNIAVQVTFSEAMDASSITNATILLRNTGTSVQVPATVTYSSTTHAATLTPSGPLSNATNYTVVVTTGVKDAAGNPLAAQFPSSFMTIALPDMTAPTIVSRTPADNANNVAVNTTVTVKFSEPMDASTIAGTTNIKLAPTANLASPVAATVTYDASTNSAILTPTAPLASGTSYTVTVTTGVKDVAGNQLAAQSTSKFTTIADTIAPTVISTSPKNDTTVAAPATITVTFSEDMNPTSVITSTSVKKTSDSSPVAGIVSYNAATMTAIFTPTVPFANGTGYTVTVTTGAKDLAGNGLTGNFTFSFTTSP